MAHSILAIFRRHLFTIVSALSLLLCLATLAIWVRSYYAGDYVHLGPFYLSFARGYCRVVNARWPFVPPFPYTGQYVVTLDLRNVGEYHIGNGASYVPLWLLMGIFATCGIWAYWRERPKFKPGHCQSCGYDLRATPDRCPECGHVPKPAAIR